MKVGKNDKFERIYMSKFRELASCFGEFVEYERDRAARDIGMHFTESRADGSEVMSPALVWFQMKGIQASTLSDAEHDSSDKVKISIRTEHLRFWYIAPETTYLVVYVEAVDRFFVTNAQSYVRDKYGDKILSEKKKTLTIHIDKKSELDAQAFKLMLRKQSISAWQTRIAEGEQHAAVFFRDANLIKRISSAPERGIWMSFVDRKYGSKTRTEVHFLEVPDSGIGDAVMIHQHWQYMMEEDLVGTFPYLEFNPESETDEDDDWWEEDEYSEWPNWELPNGKIVKPDGVFEMVGYKMKVTLNPLGEAWLQTLNIMEIAGFIELDEDTATFVSVAPFHARDV